LVQLCWREREDATGRSGITIIRENSQGLVLWFTGLSAAGKTTIGRLVGDELEQRGYLVDHLDGDVVRQRLSKGLGFSKEDRDENISRIAWVASRLARAGAVVVVSAISPYEEMRRAARDIAAEHGRFVEVHVATPLDECRRRDPKGLYARAERGELANFTGISDPYEEPLSPEVRVDTVDRLPLESAREVLDWLDSALALGEVAHEHGLGPGTLSPHYSSR
jgi:adenylyl-sulfate kinase